MQTRPSQYWDAEGPSALDPPSDELPLSSTLKSRITFLEKGRRTLPLVLRRGAERKQRAFDDHSFHLACIQSLVHRFDRILDRKRGVGIDLLQNCLCASDELSSGHDFIDQADAKGFLGA